MKFNTEELQYINQQLNSLDKLNQRLYSPDQERDRNIFQRDFTRILYSSSFRRLQGKMQLLEINSERFYRNRLTHSLEVAQIARSIAEELNDHLSDKLQGETVYRAEPYVVEAASLAHDIGNPPYGHYGERILNKLAKDIGGYEGNAQSLKILMELEKKHPEKSEVGLNLTVRSLLGVIKYYKRRSNDNTEVRKFIYEKNYDTLDQYRGEASPRTIEAQIMDLADEIAYAAHDLEDTLTQRILTIDELLYEFKKHTPKDSSEKALNDHKKAISEFEDIIDCAKKYAEQSQSKSSDSYNFYFKKEVTSLIVNRLIHDIGLVDLGDDHREESGSPHQYELSYRTLSGLAKGLKVLVFTCLNRTDKVQLYERQGEIIIKKLFDIYMNQDYNSNFSLLPSQYRPTEQELSSGNIDQALQRHVIDYIGGMMDSYAIATYEKFFGKGSASKKFDADIF